ncbi:glycosyltransferase family 4 protein [Microcoleus sp. FACHB-68]|uniref:glycosyltransferase family 4 protein n=1 Tax=Microcoleus sp. FACHB-68 TaxID=2692826 RepID=UPI00168545FC|nr:glycosyltransferase family 4 protein [Microcoleus sp. FACHB-68]MBD1939421.1 glycosyltransferase family 4 protein [Microcoleus sp. FACHB-68]
MSTSSAVFYIKDGFDTSGKQLLGRQAAGEGFLKGLVKYGTAERLYCYTGHRQDFSDFCQRIEPWAKRPRPVRWLPADNPTSLAEAGGIYKPDPSISDLVWMRRFTDERAYSICGVTHTIVSRPATKAIGDLLIAPVQPWDALICTSVAVKTAVERLLETWAEYLAQRTGSKPVTEIQLPIIPLGVDCDAFPQSSEAQEIRSRMRQELGIAPDDIVVLFVGRLIFYAKAHPVPMYLALERAVQATGAKVHLIQAGWFEDAREEADGKNSPQRFCPSVNAIFLDGREPAIRSGIWSVADIFISLADNIQETFGLTPIEAMSQGLPVIVSDWDGYQESVRHEIDGFRIPTIMPAAADGIDFASSYLNDNLNYSSYIGHAAMVTAVDIEACTRALITLIEDRELRQRMGENGKTRAREVYDWKVIIPAYEQLWQELAEIRTQKPVSFPTPAGAPPYPLCDDPFRWLSHYSTAHLDSKIILGLGSMATPAHLEGLRKTWNTNFGAPRRTSAATVDSILATIKQEGSLSVGDILSRFAHQNPAQAQHLSRTLVYLLKFDVLRLQ